MTSEREGDIPSKPNEWEPPALSPTVRLEVEFLHGEPEASREIDASSSGKRCAKVLVSSPDSHVREHVRECLRRCDDIQLIESATLDQSIEDATDDSVRLVIVDLAFVDLLVAHAMMPAIVVVDDVPRSYAPRNGRIRLLTRPFSADELVSEVRRALHMHPSR